MKKKIAAILTAAMIGTTVFASVVSAASGTIDVISREDGSGTRGAFIELFGIEEKQGDEKVDMTTEDASITNSTSVMMTTVAGDENAIGYISLGSLNDTVKAVKIDGAEASAENVANDTYKVSRPFNIITGVTEEEPATTTLPSASLCSYAAALSSTLMYPLSSTICCPSELMM